MSVADLDARVRALSDRGVRVLDARQTFVAPDVVLERVRPGATLHAGTRLVGPRTFVGSGAEVGREGPATIVDAVLAERAIVDSGYVEGAVLLAGARIGSSGHVRAGTLLEEHASTAHAVGLKQTIMLSFATIGSVVNFCDVLLAGGTSRSDHSEVGSGFIHFNFTPWGRAGDKATASLVGDVVEGVFLRAPRIFLGGAGGMVGPRKVGYGAVAAAGQVLRRDVAPARLASQPTPTLDVPVAQGKLDRVQPRADRNVEYIAQLVALRTWYREVRLARASTDDDRIVLAAALAGIELCIAERVERLRAFVDERKAAMPKLVLDAAAPACPLPRERAGDHIAWVKALSDAEVTAGTDWLRAVASAVAGG
jgi:UDP-N-acetylglucosamine/UDP-N-acetylgalactosamine diphosphorylase